MTFDKPEHKELCKKMLEASQFTGQAIDIVYELKQAILKAEIPKNNAPDEKKKN